MQKASINLETHEFCKSPTPKINTIEDLEEFHKSQVCKNIAMFLLKLVISVEDCPMSKTKVTSHVQGFIDVFTLLTDFINQTPPIEQGKRYGNKAYQTWFDKMCTSKDKVALLIFGSEEQALKYKNAWEEIFFYFTESFGNREKISYGSANELNFILVLMQLTIVGVYKESDFEALVNQVFNSYIKLMRKLGNAYFVEPAGDQGVWGLDDFHFLPFLFGSSQLKNHDHLTPQAILSDETIEKVKEDFIYLAMIHHLKTQKSGVPFNESSPLQIDISLVPSWGKVSQGLQKMYMTEVMGKIPTMKQIRFGSLLKF